jgi:hypothetical protein
MSVAPVIASPRVDGRRQLLRFDPPVQLPTPRGSVSEALLEVLGRDPSGGVDLRSLVWTGDGADATPDEDLQLALWLTYEQHYRGLAGVDDGWEWHPDLLWACRRWENQFLDGLRHHVPGTFEADDGPARTGVVETLSALAAAEDKRSLSKFLMREASSAQFAEFLVHRSSIPSRKPTRTPGESRG